MDKDSIFQLVNGNDRVPRIYVIVAAFLVIVAAVYNICVLIFDPRWRIYLIALEAGVFFIVIIGVSGWLLIRSVLWQANVIGPSEDFVSDVDTIAVIGRNE